MTNSEFQTIIAQFFNPVEVIEVKPFGSGHINDTYKVQTTNAAFILQRVNQNVFSTPALVYNYNILNKAVEQYQNKNNILLTPKMQQRLTENFSCFSIRLMQNSFKTRFLIFIIPKTG